MRSPVLASIDIVAAFRRSTLAAFQREASGPRAGFFRPASAGFADYGDIHCSAFDADHSEWRFVFEQVADRPIGYVGRHIAQRLHEVFDFLFFSHIFTFVDANHALQATPDSVSLAIHALSPACLSLVVGRYLWPHSGHPFVK